MAMQDSIKMSKHTMQQPAHNNSLSQLTYLQQAIAIRDTMARRTCQLPGMRATGSTCQSSPPTGQVTQWDVPRQGGIPDDIAGGHLDTHEV